MVNLTPTMHKQQAYTPQTVQRKQTQEIHTQKKGKQDEGRTTNTHCLRVRGLPNGTNSQYTKETATEQEELKEKNVRKRETMCETTHRKAKKKNKRDPDKCNRK